MIFDRLIFQEKECVTSFQKVELFFPLMGIQVHSQVSVVSDYFVVDFSI